MGDKEVIEVKIKSGFEELQKLIGKEILVKDVFGDSHAGKCKAINYNQLNIIISNSSGMLVIKNPEIIKEAKKRK